MKKAFLIIFIFFSVSNIFSTYNNYVPGEVLVMLKYNNQVFHLINDFKYVNLKVKEPVVEYMNIWLLEYDVKRMNAEVMLNEIRKHYTVSIAQFNHYVSERSIIPNDTRFGEQWSMNNTGQTGGTPDADIDAPEAWNIVTGGLTAAGDTIVIAVIDGGFYLNHLDLRWNKNWYDIPSNGIDDDNNGYIDDYHGWNAYNNNGNVTASGTHGTHVSGTAGALGNNGMGVAGVNWNVRIMPIQGLSGTEAVVIRAYGYALKQRRIYDATNGSRGAFVVATNSSFGVDYGQPANYPLWCAFYDSLGSAGILSACATANLNINVDVMGDIPTACPSEWMISVTNTTHTDAKNSGAAYGPTTIDLGAPGTNILSTTSVSGSTMNYGNSTGTSMATPHVAGAVALMFAAAPLGWIQAYKLNPAPFALQVKNIILQGVDPKPSLQGITVSGGRLNIYNSALLIQNPTGIINTEGIPKFFRLYQNYPNPFNPSTIISFDLPQDSYVKLKVYNLLGQEIVSLIDGNLKAGVHSKVFNASNLAGGIYFYKLTAGDFSATGKMSLIK
ncbi:MAG: S8 family peptidase [Ignavibacteria bacterium]|nr:S8 family peptidase [Ignavibacteria bacterium]